MKLQPLSALSPLDGRYATQLTEVAPLFSELNLILMRLTVEVLWLQTLAANTKIKELKKISKQNLKFLWDLVENFDKKDMEHIKDIESQIKHDVKAVEYFLKEKLGSQKELVPYQEFVHFGCTSDDINNLSYAMILATTREELLIPTMQKLLSQLQKMAHTYAATPMLARTHGQIATPTTLGKELANFTYRLTRQLTSFKKTPILGKFNGAVGNFNAHTAAYPEIDWPKVAQDFVTQLHLEWNPYTTQIEPHDWIAEYCDILGRFNTILIGFCRDIWHYIAIGYFTQNPQANEVGSSTMPHKINPIDFENAEGNLGMANSLLHHFSSKLPISRWQRDLTDSTVMRNLGVAIGHAVLAYKALSHGLTKLAINTPRLTQDLTEHWEVLAEAVQTVMRRYKIAAPYEQLKTLTRGEKLSQQELHNFIRKLKIPKEAKEQLLKLTPMNYLGQAKELAKALASTNKN